MKLTRVRALSFAAILFALTPATPARSHAGLRESLGPPPAPQMYALPSVGGALGGVRLNDPSRGSHTPEAGAGRADSGPPSS